MRTYFPVETCVRNWVTHSHLPLLGLPSSVAGMLSLGSLTLWGRQVRPKEEGWSPAQPALRSSLSWLAAGPHAAQPHLGWVP